MKCYQYVDNAKGEQIGPKWVAPVVFQCTASNLSEADAMMEKETGINPTKNKYIGVSWEAGDAEIAYHSANFWFFSI